jgi:hypothetical protein
MILNEKKVRAKKATNNSTIINNGNNAKNYLIIF